MSANVLTVERTSKESKSSKACAVCAPGKKAKSQPWQEARKQQMERARKLISDPDYPSPKVTKAVAELFTKKWQKLHDAGTTIGI